MEATVRFKGWTPSPRAVVVGMERDNKVFTLRFEGLPVYPGGTAYLHIDLGSAGADSIEIVDGLAEITRNITQYEDEKTAYVEIIANNDVVWHSDQMLIYVNPLPLVSGKIEQAYPTAFEQALAQTAADKAAAAKSAADAAATAAGIVTEEAARQDAESKRVAAETARGKTEETRAENERLRASAERERVKAENARVTAEENREKAEAAREQEVAEALASVAETENTVQGNERQRILAERTRAAQEQARQSAEQSRVEAEQARAQAEQRRETAETSRAEAEQGRVTAEKGRVEAEAQRKEAMAQHAEKIAELESEVQKKAEIDDTTVSDTDAWSSQHIVDMLCPPLEESGNPVVCYPVAGSKLGVTASWEPTQDGEGTPSPDNIRPIHGKNSVSITRQEDELSVSLTLPSTIYGGEVGADGEGQETWALLTLDGTEKWAYDESNHTIYCSLRNPDWTVYNTGICSHLKYLYNFKSGQIFIAYNSIQLGRDYSTQWTVDTWKAYLAAQYAAGTPVQIAYKLATPQPFTATGGGTIKALSGTNTVLTDADTLTVKGRADPIHIIQQLQAASAASAQALSDVERAVTDI